MGQRKEFEHSNQMAALVQSYDSPTIEIQNGITRYTNLNHQLTPITDQSDPWFVSVLQCWPRPLSRPNQGSGPNSPDTFSLLEGRIRVQDCVDSLGSVVYMKSHTVYTWNCKNSLFLSSHRSCQNNTVYTVNQWFLACTHAVLHTCVHCSFAVSNWSNFKCCSTLLMCMKILWPLENVQSSFSCIAVHGIIQLSLKKLTFIIRNLLL